VDGGAITSTGNSGADQFAFYVGDGKDRITDFNLSQDEVVIWADLWGGAFKSAAQVVRDHAFVRGGVVVLDFGSDELTLMGVSSTVGLADGLTIV
jgi:Ca2+-binding RTX toxin-like protein